MPVRGYDPCRIPLIWSVSAGVEALFSRSGYCRSAVGCHIWARSSMWRWDIGVLLIPISGFCCISGKVSRTQLISFSICGSFFCFGFFYFYFLWFLRIGIWVPSWSPSASVDRFIVLLGSIFLIEIRRPKWFTYEFVNRFVYFMGFLLIEIWRPNFFSICGSSFVCLGSPLIEIWRPSIINSRTKSCFWTFVCFALKMGMGSGKGGASVNDNVLKKAP